MTLPPVMRVFFAIDLPTSLKEGLGKYIGSLKKKSKSHAIRWTRPENLHITLQFLAEMRTEHLDELLQNVRTNTESASKRPSLTFGQLHLFPNPFRPRVIVLEILPQEDLANLADLIGSGIKKQGYALENRPFRAHLTLGRIKQPHGVDLSFLSESKTPELDKIEVDEFVLFRSEPQPEGSAYSILERIKLPN